VASFYEDNREALETTVRQILHRLWLAKVLDKPAVGRYVAAKF